MRVALGQGNIDQFQTHNWLRRAPVARLAPDGSSSLNAVVPRWVLHSGDYICDGCRPDGRALDADGVFHHARIAENAQIARDL
ncbi:hypothetical protein D3C72_2261340 [compost metagenome]